MASSNRRGPTPSALAVYLGVRSRRGHGSAEARCSPPTSPRQTWSWFIHWAHIAWRRRGCSCARRAIVEATSNHVGHNVRGIVQRRQTGSVRDIFSQSRDPADRIQSGRRPHVRRGTRLPDRALKKPQEGPRSPRPPDMREAGDHFAAAPSCELGGKSTAVFAAESAATTTKINRVKMWRGRVSPHCQPRGRLLRDRSCPSRRLASWREAHVGRASACRPCCRR